MEDTIAAVATPVGQGGIGIVRMSGALAGDIAQRLFRPRKPVQTLQSHRLYLGHLLDPETGAVVDEVLLSFMKAPHSYTREDVVEINSHSGPFLLSRILQIVLRSGARLARPGEFTFRAFMNGRMDLTQAEAVVDLIRARSEKGLVMAARQMKGRLREEIESMRRKVLALLARIEVGIDFPEDVPDLRPGPEASALETDLLVPLERLIAAHEERRIWMEGIRTVIVGRVNAGKSSLLNRLLNEERSLVTSIPGTTRDAVESTLHLGGIPLRLTDTAGFRKVRGRIESLGIRLAEQRLGEADLVLLVIDQSRPLGRHDLELLAASDKRKTLVILNKIDLPFRLGRERSRRALDGYEVVRLSALTGEGMDDLRRAIMRRVGTAELDPASPGLAPNLRQKAALTEASRHFRNGLVHLREEGPLEIIAADFQAGLEALGEIIGETTPEDVLDRIFSEFCIGK
ncbi:MAG: tRNA uridine-5-carboxymethylaminomethyl(34) synthesis GTPase MnmE [Thermodesulfobacteriota bacterium]